jgi:hypothetical protein
LLAASPEAPSRGSRTPSRIDLEVTVLPLLLALTLAAPDTLYIPVGTDAVLRSSDPAVAAVGPAAVIHGVSAGTATVTIVSQGTTQQLVVVVEAPPAPLPVVTQASAELTHAQWDSASWAIHVTSTATSLAATAGEGSWSRMWGGPFPATPTFTSPRDSAGVMHVCLTPSSAAGTGAAFCFDEPEPQVDSIQLRAGPLPAADSATAARDSAALAAPGSLLPAAKPLIYVGEARSICGYSFIGGKAVRDPHVNWTVGTQLAIDSTMALADYAAVCLPYLAPASVWP